MIIIDKVQENYEPLDKILTKFKEHFPQRKNFITMNRRESGFICGLVDITRPKKILEVGVASGGTTAMLLQQLEDRNESYEMHSVDLNKKLHNEDIGFLVNFAKDNNLLAPSVLMNDKHKIYTGKYLPQVIDEIGSNIDFVILDTVHYTPGELLDFPVMLPYLKEGALVVLHDVSLNQQNDPFHKSDAHATGLLFSTVYAKEKFLNFKPETKWVPYSYPNIAAFRVDNNTREAIGNVFLAMMLTWHYLPSVEELTIYRQFYKKHYPAEIIDLFDEAIKMNLNNAALKK